MRTVVIDRANASTAQPSRQLVGVDVIALVALDGDTDPDWAMGKDPRSEPQMSDDLMPARRRLVSTPLEFSTDVSFSNPTVGP